MAETSLRANGRAAMPVEHRHNCVACGALRRRHELRPGQFGRVCADRGTCRTRARLQSELRATLDTVAPPGEHAGTLGGNRDVTGP